MFLGSGSIDDVVCITFIFCSSGICRARRLGTSSLAKARLWPSHVPPAVPALCTQQESGGQNPRKLPVSTSIAASVTEMPLGECAKNSASECAAPGPLQGIGPARSVFPGAPAYQDFYRKFVTVDGRVAIEDRFGPNSSHDSWYASAPGCSTAWPSSSIWIHRHPRSCRVVPMVPLPLARPPVSPTRRLVWPPEPLADLPKA